MRASCRAYDIENYKILLCSSAFAGHFVDSLFFLAEKVIRQAIIHLFSNLKIREFHYHENNGHYWLNLDYTAHRPGGPYLNNKVYALIEK